MYLGPDSPEANRAGCKCPVNGNGSGAGVIDNGVAAWTISPYCPIHTKAAWWMRPPKEAPASNESGVNGR